MGHILQPDWWLYSTPDSVEDFERKVPQECNVELNPLRREHFDAIMRVLCLYDLHGELASLLADGGFPVTSQAIEFFLEKTFPAVIHLGAKMPAEIFIDYYRRDRGPRSRHQPAGTTETCNIYKGHILRDFIEKVDG